MTEAVLTRLLFDSATPMLIVTVTVLAVVLLFLDFFGGFWGRFLSRNPNWAASMDCRNLSRCGIVSAFDFPEKRMVNSSPP